MRILIVKLSSLGDIVHTLPAYKLLRKSFGDSQIFWVVEEKGKEILELLKGIKIFTVNTHELRRFKNTFKNIEKVLSIKKIAPDISFDFQGTYKSAFISFLSGSKERIGFSKRNLKEKGAIFFYTKKAPYFPEEKSVILKNISLLKEIGIKAEYSGFPELELSSPKLSLEGKIGKVSNYIVFNIGGGWETKTLPSYKWVKIIKEFKKEKAFILWGNEKERKLAEELSEKTEVPLSPELSIKELFPFIKSSKIVVSGDTFPLHIAGIFGVKTLSFWGPTPPQRNGPIEGKRVFAFTNLSCLYCFKKKCKNPLCMKMIDEEDIISKIYKLLEE